MCACVYVCVSVCERGGRGTVKLALPECGLDLATSVDATFVLARESVVLQIVQSYPGVIGSH